MDAAAMRDLVQSGIHPVVEFLSEIEHQEGYAEKGMRGRLISAGEDFGMVVLTVDVGEFADFNRSLESANHYDKDGVPRLTAREAGMYPESGHERVYLASDQASGIDESFDESFDEVFRVLDAEALALYQEYQRLGSELSYIAWLEQQVLKLRGGRVLLHG